MLITNNRANNLLSKLTEVIKEKTRKESSLNLNRKDRRVNNNWFIKASIKFQDKFSKMDNL